MSTSSRLRLAAALLAVVPMLVAARGEGGLKGWVRASMTPKVAFDAAAAPKAPDYADPAAWSALPERVDAGDAVPAGVTPSDAFLADVFYVHPTSYVGSDWNGPVDDAKLNTATDAVATGIQATAFNAVGAVWAPRYRQANGTAFFAPTPDGDRALDVAWGDVSRAFDAFLARRPQAAGRPFVLAGHSQGSVLAERLLRERIVGTPRLDDLVVAVLPGGAVSEEALAAMGVPACASPDDTGCVVAWNARGPDFVPNAFEVRTTGIRLVCDAAGAPCTHRQRRLCTNPLTWRTDGVAAPAAGNHGAVFLEARDTAPRPGFADAQCVDGTLVVRTLGKAPRTLPSRILDAVVGPQNYHPMEYQLYFMDLRANVEVRVRAHLARRAEPAY